MPIRNEPANVWRFISVGGADECWNWIGSKDTTGYGRIGIGRKYYAVHRIVYSLSVKDIPFSAPKKRTDEGHVLHTCDNRACCNPRHLFLGTQKDNMRDMVSKSRRASTKGELNPNAVLSRKDVGDIKWILSKGIACPEIARLYGVTATAISRIRDGVSWRA